MGPATPSLVGDPMSDSETPGITWVRLLIGIRPQYGFGVPFGSQWFPKAIRKKGVPTQKCFHKKNVTLNERPHRHTVSPKDGKLGGDPLNQKHSHLVDLCSIDPVLFIFSELGGGGVELSLPFHMRPYHQF